mgnify:CR=1 FL=1
MEHYDANDLLIFSRVADAGSFSRAAERLGLPKSTVSRRIALLEERLGERLMQRTTRRLTLTEFGLQLLEHARQVAAEVDEVVEVAAHLLHRTRRAGQVEVAVDRHALGQDRGLDQARLLEHLGHAVLA